MSSKESIGKLLDAQMDRRQFLGFLGAASLVIFGISGIIKGISGVANRQVGHGYGATSYGGERSDNQMKGRL
jgi:hypothetical protein